MKARGVTIQMKPLRNCVHIVLFVYYVALSFESVGGNPYRW